MMIKKGLYSIDKLFDKVSTSFWFIPCICICLAFVLLAITHNVDQAQLFVDNSVFAILYNIEPSGARDLLTTIATSVITVTSIAFSMIIVSLTLASSQFGSRLLRNFIQDKKTQLSLGIFVSTFVFSLSLIRFVQISSEDPFVPGVGLSLALFLTLLSILTLVYLIHHVAISIQADNVIDHSWQSLQLVIEKVFSDEPPTTHQKIDINDSKYRTNLITQQDGYVQVLNCQGLVKRLSSNNQLVSLSIKPGDYINSGEVVGIIGSDSDQKDDDHCVINIDEFIVVGHSRTPIQDPEFAINQVVEVAVRALSPGINDPFTAITGVHRLGSSIVMISQKYFPAQTLLDENNVARISRDTLNFTDVMDLSFNQIRQNFSEHPSVIHVFVDTLIKITRQLKHQQDKEAVRSQFLSVNEQLSNIKLTTEDRNALQNKLNILERAFE